MDSHVYLGRQPILDRHRRTWGYELLYRDQLHATTAFFTNPSDATRTVVERTLLEWGIDHVASGRRALINVGAEFLLSGLYRVLPPSNVILELLEDIEFDEAIIDVVVDAHRHGYRFAFDDLAHIARLSPPQVTACVELVKVELPAIPVDELPEFVAQLRAGAPHAMLLAEKVESSEEFERCRELGFDLFQGFFFARPEMLSRRARPVNTAAAIALLVEVQRPEVSLDRLEELVTGDPTLAFRLLTLVNSSLSGLTSRIESVHQGIVLLGTDRVRQMASLITIASNSSTNEELLVLAATRARMARLLVGTPDLGGGAFTVGLLSVIDSLFQMPMEELLQELPLSPMVAEALRDGTGPLGETLTAIKAYERADLDLLEQMRPGEVESFRLAFGDSATWASEFCRQFVPN
jgi:EAL and modified HD-GYP domain-containing signal transduction protein